jgi:hypothetical protein
MVSKRKHHQQIQAKVVFQAQTATGKLNAEIIPTTPMDGIAHTFYVVDAQSALSNRAIDESPTAKSQYQSFLELLHILLVMIYPFHKKPIYLKLLCFLRISPNWRTISPRCGAGINLKVLKASVGDSITFHNRL